MLTPATLDAMTDMHEAATQIPDLPVGPLAERMGIELTHAGPGRVSARMPVEGNTQPMGLLHGGASAVLAETVGSLCAVVSAGSAAVVGVELNATHHRAARSGYVEATATPAYEGRTMATYNISVQDDDGRLICTARLTCAIRV